MFSELLDLIERQARNIMHRQSQSDCAILAELAAESRAIRAEFATQSQAIQAELASHRALLNKILAAVILPPAVRAVLAFEVEGKTVEGEHIDMKIAQGKKGTLSVALKNAAGGPGRVDGIPTWTPSVPGVVTLTPSADGLSCDVETLPVADTDPAASVIVTFDADGDLGDGVTDIVATFAATVYNPASGAVIAEITASDFV